MSIKLAQKIQENTKIRLVVMRAWCCSKCLFLPGKFCHGTFKPDLSTLFATFLL